MKLKEALGRDVHAFDFFQALRRLECAYPEQPRIGLSERPAQDALRLAQDPALAFAASTLARLEPGADGLPDRMVVNFFGLLGPNGALPLHITEYVRERLYNYSDPTFSHFLDVFHHRMLCLFYRAWAINRPTVSFDRREDDRFSVYIASLFGMGQDTLRNRDAFPDLAKLYYAGRFASQSRHPEGLRAMLVDFFGMPVRILEFIGEWVSLPGESRCRLGTSLETGVLGGNAIAGMKMWGAQHRFRIVVGPVGLATLKRFLPGGVSFARLAAMVRLYVGDALAWDLQLVLAREDVPSPTLNGVVSLGLTAWLHADSRETDADDLIVQPEAAARSASDLAAHAG